MFLYCIGSRSLNNIHYVNFDFLTGIRMDNKAEFITKPWGMEIVYASIPDKYLGKILVIKKGHRLSRQYHRQKHETIYVLEGRPLIEHNGTERFYEQGEAVIVPPEIIHRFSAPETDVRLLEVSTYFPEDTVRLEDDYSRS